MLRRIQTAAFFNDCWIAQDHFIKCRKNKTAIREIKMITLIAVHALKLHIFYGSATSNVENNCLFV
jgi:hypothetical protein